MPGCSARNLGRLTTAHGNVPCSHMAFRSELLNPGFHLDPAQNFISDIRSAQNKEQEQKRVEKELAKIREKFTDDRSLSGACSDGICASLWRIAGITTSLTHHALRPPLQATIVANMCGSSSTSICWAMTLSSGTNKLRTSSPCPSR